MTDLQGRTIVMSGGSRGIGLAILTAAARRGANAVILAKTDRPDPRLPGTVHTAVAEIEQAGGRAVAVVGDVRVEEDVERAVQAAVDTFGGVDVVVNNASALNTQGTEDVTPKRCDLMQSINSRGAYLLTRAALPQLRKSGDAQVLTLSPPINLDPRWLGEFPPYMLSKYGMSLLTLGWAHEFAADGIRANCLWPRTTIATAAVVNLLGGDEAGNRARSPEIMAAAAVAVLTDDARPTGRTFVDDEVLAAHGVSDLSHYGGGDEPDLDFFVERA
ncbi:short-chain dehydrogenase/reductase SDR [Pseudonocardia sp. Ae168_Ps1]|uniref:SDR family oxidoreductase n=1 Tax=unclassified Pseudonocardia TaxID=2619320 RepID=UPI00094B728C|nr:MULTISPECIES: NAD(P)-dependent oxidoreductase [unclassified Pseudonocardia]OLL71952.1 short-chain dehydrogenase/reductase SDR [Pseudonocardia sp. Ae150A_Ps1]OLL77919.1 short-chain dehydrogenase/reductase SDR [Pseudonocardia sp. Ae168_Ps1]OLL87958.1 short-chain dehydrogenase/reductase SDR [Pseudonocardia sp. Ae263_Ps1]OLL92017.1 short-chain dehydrogenase/reductase SDR [Pseudonocardia sp. Ae356_Ps1]